MIRISQLGRLGGALLDEELSLDSSSSESSSSEPSGEGSPFTPSSKVLDGLSLGGEEKAVVGNQTSDSTAGDVASGVLSTTAGILDYLKHGGSTSFSPAQGQPVVAAPVSSGPSGGTIALIAVGALAVLGVGYMATRPA